MRFQVNENGVISFKEPWQYSYPNRFPTDYFFTRRGLAAAPFWSDNDIRRAGSVRYATFHNNTPEDLANEPGQTLLAEVNKYIQDRQGEGEEPFVGNWLLIAHWDNVHPSPHGEDGQSGISVEELERVALARNMYSAVRILPFIADKQLPGHSCHQWNLYSFYFHVHLW